MISRELNVTKDQYIKATKQPYSFLYVDKPMKTVKRNFYGNIYYNNIDGNFQSTKGIRGAPGIGFNLTSDGNYHMSNKRTHKCG